MDAAAPVALPSPGTLSRRARWAAVAAVFVVAAVAFRAWYAAFPAHYDADGYYHLAVARAYAERGMPDGLEWARFSIMREGFGDKELLFHWLLAPFAATLRAQGLRHLEARRGMQPGHKTGVREQRARLPGEEDEDVLHDILR